MIWTKEKIEAFWAMKDQGFSLEEIAAELGCTKSAAQNKAHELKVKEKARKANAEKATNKTKTKKENEKMEVGAKPEVTEAEREYDPTLKDEFAAKLAEEAKKAENLPADTGKKVETDEEHITAEVSPVMHAAIKSASEDSEDTAVDEMIGRLDAEEHSTQVSNMVEDRKVTLGTTVSTSDFTSTTEVRKVEVNRPAGVGKTITRAEILDAAKAIVTGERERQYGKPEDNFRMIGNLWEIYLKARCLDSCGGLDILPEDVAMMMSLLKIARIASGNYKADSFIDLAGYAACSGECAERSRK